MCTLFFLPFRFQKKKTIRPVHAHTVTWRALFVDRGHIVLSTSVEKNDERIRDEKTRDVTRTNAFRTLVQHKMKKYCQIAFLLYILRLVNLNLRY